MSVLASDQVKGKIKPTYQKRKEETQYPTIHLHPSSCRIRGKRDNKTEPCIIGTHLLWIGPCCCCCRPAARSTAGSSQPRAAVAERQLRLLPRRASAQNAWRAMRRGGGERESQELARVAEGCEIDAACTDLGQFNGNFM